MFLVFVVVHLAPHATQRNATQVTVCVLARRIIEWLQDRYPVCEDLSQAEEQGQFLEGTASVVFDRLASKLFMARSPLSSERLCQELTLHLDRLGVGGD